MRSDIKDGNLVLIPEAKDEELFLEKMKIFGVLRVDSQASWSSNKKETVIILNQDDGWNTGRQVSNPNSW
jgi:hypothetical protein